jgi:hypothetical protein
MSKSKLKMKDALRAAIYKQQVSGQGGHRQPFDGLGKHPSIINHSPAA